MGHKLETWRTYDGEPMPQRQANAAYATLVEKACAIDDAWVMATRTCEPAELNL
jgi:hypothetical protein